VDDRCGDIVVGVSGEGIGHAREASVACEGYGALG
jgi:hypothetical protein